MEKEKKIIAIIFSLIILWKESSSITAGHIIWCIWMLFYGLWNAFSPRLTPYSRNILSLVPMLSALFFFFETIEFWQTSLLGFGFAVLVVLSAFYFPRDELKLYDRMRYVTPLQDMLFIVGSFTTTWEITVILSISY